MVTRALRTYDYGHLAVTEYEDGQVEVSFLERNIKRLGSRSQDPALLHELIAKMADWILELYGSLDGPEKRQ